MNKKVVAIGGGNGLSTLLSGLKEFPLDITAIVAVSDDGKSTGKLRDEFNVIAVGDIRRVIVSLSETEPLLKELMNYRFKTTSDLDGHTLGNLLLTALINISGNVQKGLNSLGKVLKLKGKALPLTLDNVKLIADMTDGSSVVGEHNITESGKKIKKIYYDNEPKISKEVKKSILEADLIILSMGSLYTSIIPNILPLEIKETIDKSKAKVMYICNMMTQPGETDNFKVSDHVNVLNSYLGDKKVDVVVCNNGYIEEEILKKYLVLEQKDPVELDYENLENVTLLEDNFVTTADGTIKHNTVNLALVIFGYLVKEWFYVVYKYS